MNLQPAEKTEDLAAKQDDASSVDWTRSHELSARNILILILIKYYVTLIPSMTVEFCLLSTKVGYNPLINLYYIGLNSCYFLFLT